MNALMTMPALLAVLVGYLLGSIPFGLLLTKAAGHGDVRAIGSGNIGATNVLRTGNKALAVATLILDALKGTAAVLLAKFGVFGSLPGPDLQFLAGFAALLGHVFPVWLGFKGGKGIATYIGMLLGFLWPFAAIFCCIWLAAAVATRISSLAALIAVIFTPFAIWAYGWPEIAILLLTPSLLLIWKHEANIRRLLAGKEPRIGQKT
ncbi:MAG: glycerol-3-phosphate 1-O-acyltransferase PlsY [Hyphomicrobiaceae bacterium]